MELASDTVKQMAEFLDKSIEKLGKQKEKGEKKLEKEKKKVEKAENQNSILQERITGKGVHHFGSILPQFDRKFLIECFEIDAFNSISYWLRPRTNQNPKLASI